MQDVHVFPFRDNKSHFDLDFDFTLRTWPPFKQKPALSLGGKRNTNSSPWCPQTEMDRRTSFIIQYYTEIIQNLSMRHFISHILVTFYACKYHKTDNLTENHLGAKLSLKRQTQNSEARRQTYHLLGRRSSPGCSCVSWPPHMQQRHFNGYSFLHWLGPKARFCDPALFTWDLLSSECHQNTSWLPDRGLKLLPWRCISYVIGGLTQHPPGPTSDSIVALSFWTNDWCCFAFLIMESCWMSHLLPGTCMALLRQGSGALPDRTSWLHAPGLSSQCVGYELHKPVDVSS